MQLVRHVLREPLLHFLLAGGGLCVAWGMLEPADAGANLIVVDRASLLQYMQFQAQAFEPGTIETRFDALDDAQRRRLIDDFVREEALYREARQLGLENGDYVMRQRLVQKMNFLLESPDGAEPSDEELQRHLARNVDLYRIAPSWTFAHVYVDPASVPGESAERRAQALLSRLNRDRAGFSDATRHSDRFAFLQNYVERTADYIGSHFGSEFAAALQSLPVDPSRWQGPLRSDLGWHLVLVTARAPQRAPRLAEIRAQVRDDFLTAAAAARQEQAIREVIARYEVELKPDASR
jgi:hypothetical protein